MTDGRIRWGDGLAATLGGQPVTPVLTRTPRTAEASTVHHPIGKPGGGLFGVKGLMLPAYIENVRNQIMAKGETESEATRIAIGTVRNWAEGHDGQGNKVSADVQAAATAAVAEYDRDRATAKATRTAVRAITGPGQQGDWDGDGLDSSWDGDLADLPDLTGMGTQHFDAVDDDNDGDTPPLGARSDRPGGGARFGRLKAALASKGATDPGALAAWIGRKKYGKGTFTKLAAAARKKGASSMARTGELYRSYPLEDIHIVRTGEGDSTGRLVEAYAAVFDQPAEIRDHEGHYEEQIDRAAFNQAIDAARPDRNRGRWNVTCLYNHGLTIHGTPAERFSIPIGVPQEIRAESRGLLTRTLYNATALGEEILEAVRSGAVQAQSFTGQIMRSTPALRGPGDKYRGRGGVLTKVMRMQLGLREYGPTPFPAYSGAEILGVRMQLPGGLIEADDSPDDDAPDLFEDPGTGTAPGDGGTSRRNDSNRSVSNRIWRLRLDEQLAAAGITIARKAD